MPNEFDIPDILENNVLNKSLYYFKFSMNSLLPEIGYFIIAEDGDNIITENGFTLITDQ